MLNLGAATHFSQGWSQDLIGEALELGAGVIRDSVPWSIVETTAGRYNFTSGRATYVDKALAAGLDVALVFQPANNLYDAGKTTYTDKAIDAFADYVVATLAEYEGVGTIEIGNEFNSASFVSGTVASAAYAERAGYYARILEAVAEAVGERFPDVTIVGGAMHSVPVGYAMALAKAGAFEHMDAVAIHPYTSEPEQLADQLALLNEVTGGLPIQVTEFGQEFTSRDEAPSYLVKMVSVMAAAGVEEAQWYALYQQKWFANMELVTTGKTPTPAGESFAFVQDALLDKDAAVRLETESSAYAYRFGDDTLVMWGDGQRVDLPEDAAVYDARGRAIAFDGVLKADAPVIVVGKTALVQDEDFTIGETGLVADSYHDFDVIAPEGGGKAVYEGPWSYYSLRGDGQMGLLATMPGGERTDEPWTPYIGSRWLRPLRLTSESVNPVDFSGKNEATKTYALLERMTASEDGTVTVKARWDVANGSADGVTVEIRLNGETLYKGVVFNKANGHVADVTLSGVEIDAGDTLDFITGANKTAAGSDLTERRYTVVSEAPELALVTVAEGAGRTVGTAAAEHIDASGCRAGVTLDGGAGNDSVVGGAGNDAIAGGAGADTLLGGAGNDTLTADADDAVDGGAGYDRLVVVGAAGMTVDLAAASIERAIGAGGADRFDGGGATAGLSLEGGAGADSLVGGAGNDSLVGDAGVDTLVGGAGNDTLVAEAGDKVDGGAGYDRLIVAGTAGMTVDLAAAAIERAIGGSGADRFGGSAATGDLSLEGGAGADVLTGGSGDDWLVGGPGVDTLNGGAGDDTLTAEAGDKVNGGEGYDRLVVTGVSGMGVDLAAASVERAVGAGGADRFNGRAATADLSLEGGGGADSLVGGAGNDALVGGAGVDTLSGGDGNDTLTAEAGDRVDGGAGYDRLVVAGTAGMTLDLAATSIERAIGAGGADRFDGSAATAALSLEGGGGADALFGGAGNDALVGGAGVDTLSGGGGNDTLTAETGDGVDGGAGYDRLIVSGADGFVLDLAAASIERAIGGRGDDLFDGRRAAVDLSLEGGAGADTLVGGAGDDEMLGDGGADMFVFGVGGGRDRILDFGADDTLVLDRGLAGSLAEVHAAARVSGDDLVLDFGADTITLRGHGPTLAGAEVLFV